MASRLPFLLLVLCSLSLAQCDLHVFGLRATGLPGDASGPADGYVKVFSGPAELGATETVRNNVNPWWNKEFSYFNAQENNMLRLEVYDNDVFFDDYLGTCRQQLRIGSYEHYCNLEKGGVLYYSYTLS